MEWLRLAGIILVALAALLALVAMVLMSQSPEGLPLMITNR
jgi:protein-S-isoprenylcysteine O-methyltransferase Ste14